MNGATLDGHVVGRRATDVGRSGQFELLREGDEFGGKGIGRVALLLCDLGRFRSGFAFPGETVLFAVGSSMSFVVRPPDRKMAYIVTFWYEQDQLPATQFAQGFPPPHRIFLFVTISLSTRSEKCMVDQPRTAKVAGEVDPSPAGLFATRAFFTRRRFRSREHIDNFGVVGARI